MSRMTPLVVGYWASEATWSAGSAGDYRVTRDLLAEAEQFAAKADNPALMAEVLQARTFFHYAYMECPETIEVGRQAAALRLNVVSSTTSATCYSRW